MGRVFYVIILSIDRQTCSGACLKNKGDTHGFQLDALSMDLSALSTGSILYKSRKNPKWNPGIFSLLFYAWGEPLYVFLMLFSVAVNFTGGILIENIRPGKKDSCGNFDY